MVIPATAPIALAGEEWKRVESVAALVIRNLALVNEQLLGVVDDEPIRRCVLLVREDHVVLGALVIEILAFIGIRIRVISRPDDARLVVNALWAQAELKGTDEVVLDVRMLRQLQAIVVVVGTHPHNDLSFGVKDDGVVVLTHFTLEGTCLCCGWLGSIFRCRLYQTGNL